MKPRLRPGCIMTVPLRDAEGKLVMDSSKTPSQPFLVPKFPNSASRLIAFMGFFVIVIWSMGVTVPMALHKKFLCRITIFLLLSLGFFPSLGAGSEPAAGNSGSTGLQDQKNGESNPAYNDYALYIAGLTHPQGVLAASESQPAWVRYAKFINRSWEGFEKRQLASMREWASKELATARTAAVLYPFSGPDLVNVYTLFPQAKTYLMVALEPVGEIPDFAAIDPPDYFASLQRSLYEYLFIDYFVTARMETQIGQSELRGVLPLLLFFLAREQAQVLDVRYWLMKPDGAIEESPAAGPGNSGPGIPGVRIVFKSAGSAEKQTLYYFRFNLQNNSFARNQPFVSFLKSFGPFTTFTKAASYLMFSPHSSDIRQLILDQSQYVLQEDSGIPLKYFDPAVWNLKFYGTYTGPIALFRNRYQTGLAEIYKGGRNVYPLPFGIGYQFRAGTANLMFAAKKAESPADDSP
jgi:hypothetical protein